MYKYCHVIVVRSKEKTLCCPAFQLENTLITQLFLRLYMYDIYLYSVGKGDTNREACPFQCLQGWLVTVPSIK